MAVARAGMPAWTRRPGVLAAADATIFLHHGMMWLANASCLAMVIARRAFGVVEGSPVLSAASSVSLYSLTVGVLIYPVAIVLIGVPRKFPEPLRNSALILIKDIKVPPTTHQIVWKMLKDPVMVGSLVLAAFIMLIPAGDFVVDQSAPEGSQRARAGSILKDVGIFGACVVNCFIILPTTVLRQWRMK